MNNYSKVIIPINWMMNHWLAVVLDVEKKLVVFMDSLKKHTDSKGRQHIFEVGGFFIYHNIHFILENRF